MMWTGHRRSSPNATEFPRQRKFRDTLSDGNMLIGDGRTVDWTAADIVASVSRGTKTVQFSYGPDRQRFQRVDTTPQGVTATLYGARPEKCQRFSE
jgi:hypothetical protein